MQINELATLRLDEFPNLFWLLVRTDEGVTGLGETCIGAQAVEAWIHETAAPLVLGADPRQRERLNQLLQGYVGWRGSGVEIRGLSAFDIALWDIAGKATNQPVHDLLGGRTRAAIRTYNTCAGYRYIRAASGQNSANWGTDTTTGPYEDLDAFLHRPAELAHSLLEQGITAMKIWPLDRYAEDSGGLDISPADLERGLEPFAQIRAAVGTRMDIMLECHGLWGLPAARKVATALAQYQPYWIEDPLRADSVAKLAEFRRHTNIPVCASETLAGVWGFRDLLDAGATDYVMFDIAWMGGLTQALKVAALAQAHALPIAPHDCTGPVTYTASTHLSVSAPNAVLQESVRAFYDGWYPEVVTALPQVTAGMVSPPAGAGLGLELQPDIHKRPDATYRISTV